MTDNPMRGQLATAADALRHMTAGNSTLTVVSQRTGQRFTYRFQKPKDGAGGNVVFVKLLCGADNEADYRYVGTIFDRATWFELRHTRASFAATNAPSWIALDWFVRCMGTNTLRGIDVWHEGRCGRCGRKLTVPESIAEGFGPECINHV